MYNYIKLSNMSAYTDLHLNYINGKWREGSGEESISLTNPYSGEELLSLTGASTADVDDAYAAARTAQQKWKQQLPTQIRNIFDRAAAIMQDRKGEITEWIRKESGGTLAKAETEFLITLEGLRVAAGYPYEVEGRIFPSLIPGKESRMYRQPVGVIGIISPWNFASNLSMRSVAPAIATGNAVVLKPSEQTLVTGGTLIAKIFEEAGLPGGVLNVVVGSGSSIGDHLVGHETPKVISFTGSTPVGRGIAEIAAKQFKKLSLELGGNNAQIILDDAPIDRAVDATVFGKFMHQGQICMGINRILVAESIAEEFTRKFVEKVRRLRVGDQMDDATEVGPVINEKQRDNITELIDKALEEGAVAETEYRVDGNVIHPLVLSGVTNDMSVARNEVFGPVAPIITFADDDEAIRLANDTELGLSGGVHSASTERALSVARRLETGMVHINDQPVNDDANAVFGGMKSSGLGRFNGDFVKEEFTTTQWVTVQHEAREYAM